MLSLNSLKVAFTLFLFCAAATISSPAQTFTTLLDFNGTNGTIGGPDITMGGLVQGFDGNLYGVTNEGGTSSACSGGCGTVFRITPSGKLTTLHNFDLTDGATPSGGLVLSVDGDFYGTTSAGGACSLGTIFKITPGGNLSTLNDFCTQNPVIGNPISGLVQASDGNFYGTATNGGLGGAAFKMTLQGTVTLLFDFNGGNIGLNPSSVLIQGTNGNLYGTTAQGGFGCGEDGCGTVYEFTFDGVETPLYGNWNGVNGAQPEGGVIQAANGNFYGTTEGSLYGPGTVYEMTPAGNLTTIYNFCSQPSCADGAAPFAGLVQATDGNFYGTTLGTVFKLTPTGTLTALHTFSGHSDGVVSVAPLVQATDGNLYGTTSNGGTGNGNGTVFKLATGFHPFVRTLPVSGQIGSKVKILGNNLKGTTAVKFNTTAATFTVISATEIVATVPKGATTGKVHVIKPSGTLSSNVVFRVP